MPLRFVGSAALAIGLSLAVLGLARPAAAQTPVPFPRPADPAKPQGQPPATEPKVAAPSAATLGMPVMPNAEFIASYDAGRGQRYYLFGTNASLADAAQEVEVRFTPHGAGTRVDLEHRGWEKLGERAAEARSNYDGGWVLVFETLFAQACANGDDK